MGTPGSRAVLERDPQQRPDQRQAYQAGLVWMRWLPPAAMLAVGLWGVTGASYWRDEAATLTAVRRPFTQLVRMLGHVDAVHGAYYLVLWPVVRLAGPGELATRLPSLLAMVVAAALVGALGRRLATPLVGLAAGLLFVVLPQISRYAQEARSYAMVTALAVTASYLLVRAAGTHSRKARRGWLAWYAVCVGVMGALDIFAMLLIVAHAATVGLLCLHEHSLREHSLREHSLHEHSLHEHSLHEHSRDQLRLAAEWAVAVAVAVALTAPVLVYGYLQKGTLSWLATKPQGLSAVAVTWRLIGPPNLVQAGCVVSLLGLTLSLLAGWRRLRAAWPWPLIEFSVPWVIMPPLILIGISFLTPVYTPRYVVFCLPAVALIAGAGLAAVCQAAGSRRAAATGPAEGLAASQGPRPALGAAVAADARSATAAGLTTDTGPATGNGSATDTGPAKDEPATDTGAGQGTGQPRPGRQRGAGLTWLGWLTGVAGLALISLTGLNAQAGVRSPAGHGDNIRKIDMIIAANRQPGDALIEIGNDAMHFTAAYPYGLAQLDNIAQAMTPSAAGNLAGTLLPTAQIRQRLTHVRRVWLVSASAYPAPVIVKGLHFRRYRAWRSGENWAVLWRRTYR
jgi:mannosyltransferase